MSKRRETLKESLGLTEYPWSSDEDDDPVLNLPTPEPPVAPDVPLIPLPPDPPLPPADPAPAPELPLLPARQPNPGPFRTSGPSTSGGANGSPGANSMSELRRSQALFWRLLSHPRRVSSISISSSRNGSRPPPPQPPLPMAPRVSRSASLPSAGRPARLDPNVHQRILAIRRLRDGCLNRTTQHEGTSSRDTVVVEEDNLDAAVNAAVERSYSAFMAQRASATRPRHARTAATDRPQSSGPPTDPRPGARPGPRRRPDATVNVLDSDDGDELSRIGQAWSATAPGRTYVLHRGFIREADPRQSDVSRDVMFPARRPAPSPRQEPPPPGEPAEDNDATDTEENVDVEGVSTMGSANTSALALEEEIVEIDCEPERAPASAQPTRPDPLPSSSLISGPAPSTSNAIVEQQPHGTKRKHEAMEEGEPATVKEFNSNLLRLLECPVCLEWMEPPMCQCRRGHLVCGRCRARLQSCPVCRTAFSSVRNRAMEGVADLVRYPCRHGCGREVKLRRRAPHESSCAARRYRCVMPACADRAAMPHDDLEHHFQNKHLPYVKIGRKHKFSLKVNAELHENWVVMALHGLFHVRIDVDVRTWGVVVYAAFIGPKCFAPNYTYEITIEGQYNARKLSYTRATHCDLECTTLNVSRQDCFHLTLDQALNFLRVKNRHCEPDELLHFTLELSQLEDPPKDDSDS